MYALVDVNSFYASCEMLFRPDLKHRPVVVLSNNDGCIIARNRQAKLLNIPMGAPFFKVYRELARYDVAVFSSNYALYADMSARVMDLLEQMAVTVEVYSIDEAFLELGSGQDSNELAHYGQQIKTKIQQCTGLTVGVGIAATKTLAKLASLAAKQWRKTDGVVELSSVPRQKKLMSLINTSEVWGVGRQTANKLKQCGIYTALQLSEMPISFVRQRFGVVLERTVRELRGDACLMLEEEAPLKQHILCSRSFSERSQQYTQVREAICCHAVRAAEKLRFEQQACRYISAFIKTDPFKADASYYSPNAGIKLPIPTSDSRQIMQAATTCLKKIWRPNYHYQKCGVMLGDFYQQNVVQPDLFGTMDAEVTQQKLMQVMDELNRQKTGTLKFASQGTERRWEMKRQKLSPCYTTRVADLLRVKF